MIKWKIYRTTKNVKRALQNMMNINAWKNAFKFVSRGTINQNSWEKTYKKKLEWMEAVEVFPITRRR